MRKENAKSITITRQLLALVRSSLWQTPVAVEEFADSDVDWEEIWKLSMVQTVGVLAIEGAVKLPKEFFPPKEWIQRSFAFIECNRRTHILLDKCVADSFSQLLEKGIRSVLLKGQAYSRAYPYSELRQCGDIDLYVGEKNYYKAYAASEELAWKSKEIFNSRRKHFKCIHRGVSIELHRIAGELSPHYIDRKFQLWSRLQLNCGQYRVNIEGEDIIVPPPLFNVVFVFMHLYLHFLNGGIGLRHLCDWAMLLHYHFKDIKINELEEVLKQMRLMRAWRLFTPIAVDHLGLHSQECPFYSSSNRKNAARIMQFVIKEGNFGRGSSHDDTRPKGYLASKIYSLKLSSYRFYSRLWIDPVGIFPYYMKYIRDGIIKLFNRKKG